MFLPDYPIGRLIGSRWKSTSGKAATSAANRTACEVRQSVAGSWMKNATGKPSARMLCSRRPSGRLPGRQAGLTAHRQSLAGSPDHVTFEASFWLQREAQKAQNAQKGSEAGSMRRCRSPLAGDGSSLLGNCAARTQGPALTLKVSAVTSEIRSSRTGETLAQRSCERQPDRFGALTHSTPLGHPDLLR